MSTLAASKSSTFPTLLWTPGPPRNKNKNVINKNYFNGWKRAVNFNKYIYVRGEIAFIIIIYFENDVHIFHATLGLDLDVCPYEVPLQFRNTAHSVCKPNTSMSLYIQSINQSINQSILFIALHTYYILTNISHKETTYHEQVNHTVCQSQATDL